MKLLVASGNAGKIREIKKMLVPKGIEVFDLSVLRHPVQVEEDGKVFLDNALKKARVLSDLSDMAVLADDSGLEVEALNGRPGVHSARYAGEGASDEENNKKLLAELAGFPKDKRKAAFVCAMALKLPDGREFTSEGRLEGYILEKPRGEGGFGYDPLFAPQGKKQSLAELSLGDKNKLSHRMKALEALMPALLFMEATELERAGETA